MNEDLKIRIGLEGDRQTNAGLDRTRRKMRDLGTDTDRTSGKMARAGKTAGMMRGGLLGIARMATAAAAAVTVLGVTIAKRSIDAASNLAETSSKVETTFGKQNAAMVRWSKSAAETMGMSRREALDGAAAFAAYGKAAGVTGKPLTKFSTGLTQAAADMGSFHNVAAEDALQAIRSGLAGEAEPLKRFNIFLTDARLKAEAMAQGLELVDGKLTPQQKVLAAHGLILKDLGDAQGDFKRTSGSLANQQKTLNARWEDSRAVLGKGLLPIAIRVTRRLSRFVAGMEDGTGAGGRFRDAMEGTAKFVGKVAEKVGDAWRQGRRFVGFLKDGGTAGDTTAIVLSGLAGTLVTYKVAVYGAAAATRTWAIAQGLLNVAMSANPLLLVISALVGIGVALVTAYNKVEWFRKGVDFAWRVIKKGARAIGRAFSSAWGGVKAGFGAVLDWLKDKWNSFAESINSGLSMAGNIPGIPDDMRLPTFGGGGVGERHNFGMGGVGAIVRNAANPDRPQGVAAGRSVKPGTLSKRWGEGMRRNGGVGQREVVVQVDRREIGRAFLNEAAWQGARG